MNEEEPQVNFIFTRIAQHSLHSGYDQLVRYIECRVIKPNYLYYFLSLWPERILAQLRRTAGPWYNSLAFKQELQVIADCIVRSNSVYHFLYGEDSFHYTGYGNLRKSNKIVVTYHNPPEKFNSIIHSKNHLKTVDAVIVVSSPQVDYIESFVERERIYLVPHGIDVDFFYPLENKEKFIKKNCLFVGTHLRDFETMRKVISKVNGTENDISFTVVTDREYWSKFLDLRNTRLLEKISEVELLNLYRESDVLVLPIIDCTANNTLLEALACSLPVITNDVGGVRDYLDSQCAIFIEPGDAELMAKQLVELLNNDTLRQEMSLAARKKALQFDWKIIAGEMKEIYKAL